ncbi:phosphonoacetaldehyde reductase [Uliginosibacterium sp. 31-12]|uniref:phosphonoacetaldehyde reductase n=1 Tax=Uliginosibacterium sp. 31-12 TaxID=3062781 RepID=UPI0026E3CAD3|nr:phosphonoacetaldehyde reductase [Uliginosibacterium sp. 31-12]MDO6386215.1 phosphonoacetaldehyde reductase [Uliginosibacterium sp. 31-12]
MPHETGFDFQHYNPVRTIFGPGSLEHLPELVGKRRVLLVTFKSAREIGLLARLKGLLGDRLVDLIDEVPSRPELKDVQQAHERIWRERRVELVVAVGGGSVIDYAKALLCLPESGHFFDLITRSTPVVKRLRLIAVPTTAGSGSEVTPFSVLWDTRDANPTKFTLHQSRIYAETALIDPELTLSLPKLVMRNSGLDALSHALEAIWNVNATPMTDLLAVEAARTLIAKLPIAWHFQGHIKARIMIARAAWQAGLCLAQTRTALAHALSYPLTIKQGTPHGLASSWSLPWVWQQAQNNSAERDAVLSRIYGPSETDPVARLCELLYKLEVPTEPQAWGLSESERARIVLEHMHNPKGHNFIAKGLRL